MLMFGYQKLHKYLSLSVNYFISNSYKWSPQSFILLTKICWKHTFDQILFPGFQIYYPINNNVLKTVLYDLLAFTLFLEVMLSYCLCVTKQENQHSSHDVKV